VYVGYARLRGPEVAPDDPTALALLGWGTTAGVAALALPLALPTARTGLRLQPTLRFPAGAGRRAVRLAAAGMAVLLAQQAAILIIMVVANRVGGAGVFVVFSYVQAVYLLPYAVLAVPVATIAFPRLSELASDPQATDDTDRMIARTSRLVVVLGLLGAALLFAAAGPLGHFFSGLDAARSEAGEVFPALSDTVRVIAWAVPGWCFVAWGTRVFYALERSRIAAIATAVGWSAVALSVVAGIPLVTAAPAPRTLVLVGAAHVVGMTIAGLVLLLGILRDRGTTALAGLPRTLLVAGAAAVLSSIAGALTAHGLGDLLGHAPVPSVVAGLAAGTAAVLTGAALVALLDRTALTHLRALR
jgi:putative peptidoglycan lipid II flippase